jgi:hypothetical protein
MSESFLSVDIGEVSLGDLISPSYNPRHDIRDDPEQYEFLYKSITRFSYANLITVNRRNMHIVSGNQRYKVICDMCEDKGFDINEVRITVLFVDMDEAEEMAANSVLNHVHMSDDKDMLAIMMDEIRALDEELLDFTGFPRDDVDKMIAEISAIVPEQDMPAPIEEKKEKKTYIIKIEVDKDYEGAWKEYVSTADGLNRIRSMILREILGGGHDIFKP